MRKFMNEIDPSCFRTRPKKIDFHSRPQDLNAVHDPPGSWRLLALSFAKLQHNTATCTATRTSYCPYHRFPQSACHRNETKKLYPIGSVSMAFVFFFSSSFSTNTFMFSYYLTHFAPEKAGARPSDCSAWSPFVFASCFFFLILGAVNAQLLCCA